MLGLYREFTKRDRKAIKELIRDQSRLWDSPKLQTALDLIRGLLFWIEKNELTRKEVDHSAINSMYVDWFYLKEELIRSERISLQERR